MDSSSPVFIYADLETEGLRGDLLLQIAAVTSTDSFSIYINPHRNLPSSCTDVTGLSYFKGSLYKNGNILESDNSISHALKVFNKWLSLQGSKVHLVFHNAFGFDARVLIKHYIRLNIQIPDNVQTIYDSLPALRKQLKSDKQIQLASDSLKLTKLGCLFGLSHSDPHNAISDSQLLKQICETYCERLEISIETLLGGYFKTPSFFIEKLKNPKKKN